MPDHKECRSCGKEKPLSDYYEHPEMSDGHLNTCKECKRQSARGSKGDWDLGEGPGDKVPDDQRPQCLPRKEDVRWVPGMGQRYAVSDTGCIFSYTKNWGTPSGAKEMSLKEMKSGYLSVGLNKDGSRRDIPVHRVVLISFRGRHPDKEHCRHLNGQSQDNRITNLRWGTPVENYEDAVEHGTAPFGEERYNSKLTRSQVIEIRRRYSTGNWTQNDLGNEYGVDGALVGRIIRGENWPHVDGPIKGEDYRIEGTKNRDIISIDDDPNQMSLV